MGQRKNLILIILIVIGFLIIFSLLVSKSFNVFPIEAVSQGVAVELVKRDCKNENYQALALRSLRRVNGIYQLVSEEYLNDPDLLKAYLGKAKSLCAFLLSDHTLEVTKNSDTQWTYRFIIKPQPMGISQAYGLVNFEGSWRFVLPQSARL